MVIQTQFRFRTLGLCVPLCAAVLAGGSAYAQSSPALQLSAPELAAGLVSVAFTLGATADVALEFSTDGGQSWSPATVTDGDDLLGLAAGVEHSITWDSLRDVGFRTAGARLRIVQAGTAPGSTDGADVALTNLRAAAQRVESHMIHLAAMDTAAIEQAKKHRLVVLNPADATVTPAVVAEIQAGLDPEDPTDDVIVLGYLFVGEDVRTIGRSDADLLADPMLAGDGTGPRIDPRGADADGQALSDVDPLGAAAMGSGYAPYYMDDNSVDADGVGDGVPDRNPNTGACFVNAGHPDWFAQMDTSLVDGPDQVAGIREILSLDYGRGFGCDGVFLSGMDTCAPNSFTSSGDPVQSEFEWTAGGYRDFVARMRVAYPEHVIAQNRGIFYYRPGTPHYQVRPGSAVDFVVFESYRLDRSATAEFNPYFFADNKFNLAPKLQAEASRRDGFRILSIGYAEGPSIASDTLLGLSAAGEETLLEDIAEAQNRAGFRHYLTTATGDLANSFVRDRADLTDTDAPVWTSTLNAPPVYPEAPTAPTARVGVQALQGRYGAAVLRWDVAMDLNPVHYVAYYKLGRRIRFVRGEPRRTTRVKLTPQEGAEYEFGVTGETFPFEAAIDGLTPGRRYAFCIRAVDALGNEDQNEVVLHVRTMRHLPQISIDGNFTDWRRVRRIHRDANDAAKSAGPNWRTIKACNDGENLYLMFTSRNRFQLDGAPDYAFSRTLIMMDVDADATTGWSFGGMGSDLLVNGDGLFTQSGTQFNTGMVTRVDVNTQSRTRRIEMAIPLSALDQVRKGTAHRVRLVFLNDETWDVAPDAGFLEVTLKR